MKKFACMGLALALMTGLMTGCATTPAPAPAVSKPAASTPPAVSTPVEITGTVNTDGSTSMEKVVKALAEAFMAENKGVTVNYSGTGSGTGVESALSATADIGLASRELKSAEEEKGAVGSVVALDGVAIIVNPQNPIADLTVEQIAQIAKGEITNWKDLGGSDAPIAFNGREAGSGTRGAFEEIVGVADACKYANEYNSTGDVVGSVAGNPNAVGYVSLSSVNDTVKSVTVNGTACTEDTIKNGSYAIQRPFLMVTKKDATLSPAAQAFLDFAMSDAAAELIAIAGAVAP